MKNLFDFLLRRHFFILFLLLEILSFILIIQNNYFQRSGFINTTNNFAGSVLAAINNISQYFSLTDVNRKLAEENARLLSESKNFYLKTDNKIFYYNDTLYRQQYSFINTKVISNSTGNRNNYLTLNKGSIQGITTGMGVITSAGIVGVVREVSPNFSSVISLLNKKVRISAKIKKNGHIGTIIWKGDDYRYGNMIDVPTHVKPLYGDTIVTSGYSDSFPEGIMIGVISAYKIERGDNFYTIVVKFSTDFNNISYAYVIKDIMKDELKRINNPSNND